MPQRNFRQIPASIRDRVAALPTDDVRVGVVRKVTRAAIQSGDWSHLGIVWDASGPTIPAEHIPPATQGRFSKANRVGFTRTRTDLPKVEKTFSVETPNWGDWSRGSHTMSWTRMCYQREFFPPNELVIEMVVLNASDDEVEVRFLVGRVLDRTEQTFEKDLFYDLNLLQENVGAVYVFSSTATRAEYLATVAVTWEILPPGHVDEVVDRIATRLGASQQERGVIQERMAVLAAVQPRNYVTGTSGFARYFGAQFGDDLVIFENLQHGNAAYAMYENWQTLSQLSRTELLNGNWAGFDRIVHRAGWQHRIRGIIARYRTP